MTDPLQFQPQPDSDRAAICSPPSDNDLLSEVLRDLRLAHASYGRTELTSPWGLAVPFREGVRFHAVLEGHCWIKAEQLPPLLLEKGDLLLLPHGTEHIMSDDPKRRPMPLAEAKPALIGNGTYELKSGGGGARSLIVCCTIGFEGPTANPLLDLLPSVMHVRRADHDGTDLSSLLGMMAREVEKRRVGSATVMARLADIVMTQVIRTWVETRADELTGWLAAVRDPQIGMGLATIHRTPGENWTVDRLAAIAGLSRSRFSYRFRELLSVSPARYILQWRLRLAASWLRNEYMSLSQVAEQLGYESDASFSRAFKRFMGVPPGAARARGRSLERNV
ncbi:AraC family transcriptional regulator [Sphingomonas sp. So64.6b]|uniref:AraC family transcriptional regulator n=1 Tax=Sphingomonas sp. So64.6b TaxID=2997354 RepID=UPI0016000496|nr:AraC family transcriptional regulator [Sphingomonas sp. So64.6b]QNA83092.1 AraC family transcriptional regulator [Sphingomonas sp. So64.6b]